jgi:hypothetical protein
VGAGDDYNPSDTGGDVLTGMAGAHTHTVNQAVASITPTTLAVAAGVGATVVSGVTANGHTHTVNQVGDHQHGNLPPYLALCFIMKL